MANQNTTRYNTRVETNRWESFTRLAFSYFADPDYDVEQGLMTLPATLPTLPQYMVEGLSKQDDQTLHDAREFIDELLAAREHRREQPISEDELPADAEVIEAKSSSTGEDAQNTSLGSPVINDAERAAGAVW